MSEKNSDSITNAKQFTSGLNIEANVGCKLNINYAPAGDDRITVRVTGTKRRVDAITVEERGGDIVINESYGDGNVVDVVVASGDVYVNHGNAAHVGPVFGSVTVNNRGVAIGSMTVSGAGAVGVNMSGGRVTVNGVDVTDTVGANDPPATIDVTLPMGSKPRLDLELSGTGVAMVSVSCAKVKVRASGCAGVGIANATKLKVRAMGTANVAIAEMVGDCDIGASGCAVVAIKGGIIGNLEVDASGTANVGVFAASADEAGLEASGMARITVARVKRPASRSVSGMAQITVTRTG